MRHRGAIATLALVLAAGAAASPAAARTVAASSWEVREGAAPAREGRLSIPLPNAISTELTTRNLRELTLRFGGGCPVRGKAFLDGSELRPFRIGSKPARVGVKAGAPAGLHSLRLELSPLAGCARGRVVLESASFREWIPIGSETGAQYIGGDPEYRRFLAEKVDSITLGTDTQWSIVEPSQGIFSFGGADRVVDYATGNGLVARGHPLVWRYYLPTWLTRGTFTRAQMIEILRTHIQGVVGRYAGVVSEWDVVNEPITPEGRWRKTPFYRALGPDYVALAFQFAREADPTARLYLNDFGIENVNRHSDAILALATALVEQGAPIDGVGFQFHTATDAWPQTEDVLENWKRFSELGLGIQISEMDVRDATSDPGSAERRARQADAFEAAARACRREVACERFSMWGISDRYSWLGSEKQPLPFDRQLKSKPAWAAITDVLRPRG